MDRVDSFRVSEADLLKWEKGCELLKNAASSSSSSGGYMGPSPGLSKAMRGMKHALQRLVEPQVLVRIHMLQLLWQWVRCKMWDFRTCVPWELLDI